MKLKEFIKAYLITIRYEYIPGMIPALMVVLFLGSSSLTRFLDIEVMEALLAFSLLYFSGFLINALVDRELDAKYDTFKKGISGAVDDLGTRTLKLLIISHVGVAIALSLHITLLMDSFVPIFLVLIGSFFGLGYSVKPFHFKVHGIWHGIALGSSAFLLPFTFLIFVIGQGISWPMFVFILGFSFAHYAMEFGNQAIDYLQDKKEGVMTPPVRWGLRRSLVIALWLAFVGLGIELSMLYLLILEKGNLTVLHPLLDNTVSFGLMGALLMSGYLIPIKGLWRMSTLLEFMSEEAGMPHLQKICNYAKWQASGMVGLTIVSGLLFSAVLLQPVVLMAPAVFNDAGELQVEDSMMFTQRPSVYFFEDGDDTNVMVNISLHNRYLSGQQNLRIAVESLSGPFVIDRVFQHLYTDMEPGSYWNLSTELSAHESDDTSVRVSILARNPLGDYIDLTEPVFLDAIKDLYIYKVEPVVWRDTFNRIKFNVTITVCNDDYQRPLGTVELRVVSYTPNGFKTDDVTITNTETLRPGTVWSETINDILSLSYDAYFDIYLSFENSEVDSTRIGGASEY